MERRVRLLGFSLRRLQLVFRLLLIHLSQDLREGLLNELPKLTYREVVGWPACYYMD